MNALETEQQFYNYVSNYSDILEIQVMDNGEKEVAEKEISLHSIASFLNADRIVKVGDNYEKFISNIEVTSNDYSQLKQILDSKKTLGLTYKEVYRIHSGSKDKTHIGTTLSWEATKDQRRCKNDRKVTFYAYFNYEPVTAPNGVVFDFRRPKMSVVARRKGIPCIWYNYRTKITWNDFYVEYSVNSTNEVWTEANKKTNNVKALYHSHNLIGHSNSPNVTWERTKSKVTTRGMGTSNLTIDF
jgi:hypothetical protein